MDLKKITSALDELTAARQKVQTRMDELLKRKQWLQSIPLPKDDFIAMIIEEQGLRENDLSHRLFMLCERRINEPMAPLKIKGVNDSPLCWPRGTFDIPNDVWHILFAEQINRALVAAMETWDWPEEVGPTRAEREKEMAVIDKELAELKAWLDQAAQLAPEQPGTTGAPPIVASTRLG